MAALDAAVAVQAEWGGQRRRTTAARSSGTRSSCSPSAPTSWRSLMTLEMGKPVAESKAEIVYAADFFRWFSGRGAADRRATTSSSATAPAGCSP